MKNIPSIKPERNYWFVRTDGGYFYEEFIAKQIIAIGWNEVNDLDLIRAAAEDKESDNKLEEMIKKVYPDENRPKYVARQIKQFVNDIQEGDIVLIPSTNSWRITFGVVESGNIETITNLDEGECDWEKRKKVTWLKTVERQKLDPYLYQLFYSQHTVSYATPYSTFIDRTLHSFFIKGDRAHLIVGVQKKEDIPASDVAMLMHESLLLLELFSKETGIELDLNVGIKINVQSEGKIEFFGKIKTIWVMSLLVISLSGGSVNLELGEALKMHFETPGFIERVLQFTEQHKKYELENNRLKAAVENLEAKLPDELIDENTQ